MTAYDKGYEAFLYGDSDKENPYDFGTDNYDEWLNRSEEHALPICYIRIINEGDVNDCLR